MYKFARFEDEGIKKYEFHSYEDAKFWVDRQIERFKIINHVKNDEDKSFINFKSELYAALKAQKYE